MDNEQDYILMIEDAIHDDSVYDYNDHDSIYDADDNDDDSNTWPYTLSWLLFRCRLPYLKYHIIIERL